MFVDTRPGENNIFESVKELLNAIPELNVRLERKQLLIGDIQINNNESIIIIERKTWSDLVSSLNDGRYTNQKARLIAERERNPQLKFVYLIEGNPPPYMAFTRTTPNAHAYAALTKMAIRDNICSLWCATFIDTARMVLYIVKTAAKDGFVSEFRAQEGAEGAPSAAPARGYSQFVKHASKRKNTEENAWEIMLTSISGVSTAKAIKIMEMYPTPKSLFQAYAELERKGGTDKEMNEMLAGIYLLGDHGEADVDCRKGHVFKRLGPVISTRIRNIFHPQE